jgi:Ser/Thr protein kinase RdoA (MazF antagonist)
MPNFVVQVYKHANSPKPPEIKLPQGLPQQELINPTLIKTAGELFSAHGVLVVKNLFAPEFIANLHQAFVQHYHPYFHDREYAQVLDVGNKRKMLTVDFQAPFNAPELYGNPLMLSLMEKVLGGGFVLGSFGAVIALPGAQTQHFHRDHPALFELEMPDLPLPSFAITLVVPLVDLTSATGSTRVWKGTHRNSGSDLDLENSFVPFLSTGSCYLMDYQLLHGGTANLSNTVRPILYLIYYRSWFQEVVNYEKQLKLAITHSQYQAIPEQYKFLFQRVKESIDFNHILFPHQDTTSQAITHPSPKDFSQFSASQQAQVLTQLTQQALKPYGIKRAQVQLISHGDNTVFAVKTPDFPPHASNAPNASNALNASNTPNRFLLRIHRANYLSSQAIESELQWLAFLGQDAQFPVARPIAALTNQFHTIVQSPDLPEPRVCSLIQWLEAETIGNLTTGDLEQLQPQDFEAIGRTLAQLHHHGQQWELPSGFDRPHWNWEGLFGTGAGYSNQGPRIWELIPPTYRSLFETVSEQIKIVMATLGESKDQFGLIHGDFWLGNLLVCQDNIYPIDFADCGFGYWGYDLARFVSDCSPNSQVAEYLQNLLSGYRQIRPFPVAQLPHIPLFIAAHQVTLALWRRNRAQDHPSFRSTLAEDLQDYAEAATVWLAATTFSNQLLI